MLKINILIIGGSNLLGEQLAFKFAPYVNKMILVARNQQKLQIVKTKVENEFNIKPTVIACDLNSIVQIDNAIKIIENLFDKIDLILNVAGGNYVGNTFECKMDDFLYMIGSYIKGQTYFIKSLLPLIRKSNKTLLVNFLTDWINRKAGMESGNAIYSMTKSAMETFSNCLVSEEHKYGLQISNLYLGEISESTNINDLPKDKKENIDVLFMDDICNFVLFFINSPSINVFEATLLPKSPSYARNRIHTNSEKWDI